MSDFHFLYPWRLLALLLCPLVYFLARGSRSAWHRIMTKPFAEALIRGQRRSLFQVLPWLFAAGCIALAGPSWQKELPAGMAAQTQVMIILQQDLSMLAQDLPPSRHQRMQPKIEALLSRLPGSHIGLVVYNAQAFLTTPMTNDSEFFRLFLQAQQPTQLPEGTGSGLQAAVALAIKNLPQSGKVPYSLLLVADNLTVEDARWLAEQKLPLQVWVPGTAKGGAMPEKLATRGIDTRLNVPRFEQLRNNGVPVTLATADDDDLPAILQNIQQSVVAQQNARHDLHWKNSGYLLVIPMLLLLLVWRQQMILLLLLFIPLVTFTPPASAAWSDAFISPDKQGQRAFDRGDYAEAASHFTDPLWRGIALYNAGDFAAATTAFLQAPTTPDSLLWIGNSYAQQKQWQQALTSYDQALSLRPDWPMAGENRGKIAEIIMQLRQKERDRQDSQRKEQDETPDEIKEDLTKDQGVKQQDMQAKAGTSPQVNQWYENLSLSPSGLLENLYNSAPAEAK
ncbi:vWA domain-containing protein [Erwinia sp.]|uniref:vWA domain-containing protein n=1 Tax=Erwinia citreus TaxID=558 RepID=UPI003C742E2E